MDNGRIYWLIVADNARAGRRTLAERLLAELSEREHQLLAILLRSNLGVAKDFLEERGYPRGLSGAFLSCYADAAGGPIAVVITGGRSWE